MKTLRYLLFFIIIYIFFFDPPIKYFFGGARMSYFLIVASFFTMLNYWQKLNRHLHLFRREFIICLFLLVFSILRSGVVGERTLIIKHFLAVANLFVVIPFIFLFAERIRKYNVNSILNYIFIVSAVAGSVSCLCLFVPEVDSFMRNNVIQYDEEDYLFFVVRRGFGLSSGLTSYYGYIQGSIAVLGLINYKEHRWFLYFVPIVFLAAMVNARTGMLITIWGALLLAFSRKERLLIPLSILLILSFIFMGEILGALGVREDTLMWLLDFHDQFASVYSGGDTSDTAFSHLFGDMIILPSSAIGWIMGSGISLFRTGTDVHTDVGWIIQLNYGGLLYIVPLYYLFVYMIKRLLNNGQKYMAYFFAGVIVLINTKSSLFPGYGEFLFIMLIYCLLILQRCHILPDRTN